MTYIAWHATCLKLEGFEYFGALLNPISVEYMYWA